MERVNAQAKIESIGTNNHTFHQVNEAPLLLARLNWKLRAAFTWRSIATSILRCPYNHLPILNNVDTGFHRVQSDSIAMACACVSECVCGCGVVGCVIVCARKHTWNTSNHLPDKTDDQWWYDNATADRMCNAMQCNCTGRAHIAMNGNVICNCFQKRKI